MAEQDDVYVGRTLLESGRVSRDALLECLFEMAVDRRASRAAVPLGVILARKELVKRQDVAQLIADRVRPPEGAPVTSSALVLGELLVAAGAVTPVQVNECLKEIGKTTAAGQKGRRLGELLVEKGFATAAQIKRTLAYQNKLIARCIKCATQFNVVGARYDCTYRCPTCGGDLVSTPGPSVVVLESTHGESEAVAPIAGPIAVAASQMPTLPPESEAHLDRAVSVYMHQKLQIRKSVLNDAERFQFELSRYGLWAPLIDIVSRFGGCTWQQAQTIREIDFDELVKTEGWRKQAVPGYRVAKKIATGGFGTIFAGEPVFGGKRVALKVMHADRANDPEMCAAFKREASLMIRFTHPGIVRGIDYSEEGPLRFLVMELVEGDSLDRVVLEGGGLSPHRTLEIAREIASALSHMYGEGYIHRDVKPQNVLITPQGKSKLCDLGLAMEMKSLAIGNAPMTIGTPAYMSPEQMRGERDLKAGTDIYALGRTMIFMLSPKRPASMETSDEVPPSEKTPAAGPDLARVTAPAPLLDLLRRMTEPDRQNRFATYQQLLAEMEEVAAKMRGS